MRIIDADALHEEISAWPESVMFKDWVQSAIANASAIYQSPNDPLTLDELLKMDEEPVWVVGLSSINDFKGHWDILILDGENNELAVFPRCLEFGWFKDYGITWTAYRRRPEENAHGMD